MEKIIIYFIFQKTNDRRDECVIGYNINYKIDIDNILYNKIDAKKKYP